MIQIGPNHNFFDQSRFYLGLQWLPNENTEIEIGFLHQFLQKSDATGFFNRSILRLGIEQTLATKPRKKTT
jgi:hypothetical protein